MDWQQLSATSHYQTAVAARDALQRGDTAEASAGIQELIDALARSEKRALRSQLVRLMVHVIKWKTQPKNRSRSWRASIGNARSEIADIQEETPSLTNKLVQEMWEQCFERATEQAEAELNQQSKVSKLTWADAFEKEYDLQD